MMARSAVVALGVGCIVAAFAQPSFADARVDARTHYERGTSLFDLGKYHDAAVEYEKAYELKNDPALLFNIGQAYRLANDHVEALTAYRSYLRRSPDAPNRVEVQSHIDELQQIVDSEKRSATSPPMGVLRPGQAPEGTPPAPPSEPRTSAPGAPSPEAVVAPATTPVAADVVAASPEHKPFYKKWWFWTAVGGVVVAGAVVGIAVAATTPQNASAPAGAYTVSF